MPDQALTADQISALRAAIERITESRMSARGPRQRRQEHDGARQGSA